MSVIIDVEVKEGTEEAAPRGKYALKKGSPEALGALLAEGSAPPWYETAYLELAEQGCRVLALALRQLDADADASKLSGEEVERDLRFVGFIAFECKIRADSSIVIDALKGRAAHGLACCQEQLLCGSRQAQSAGKRPTLVNRVLAILI